MKIKKFPYNIYKTKIIILNIFSNYECYEFNG